MFYLAKRFIAYLIDMMVIMIIVYTISSIPFINTNKEKYNEEYNKYLENYNEYYSFRLDLLEYYEDEELTTKEYKKLVKNSEFYQSILDKYYKDNKLSKKSYNKLIKEIDETYNKEYKKTYYKLEKYNLCYNISYTVVVLLYFVGFNILTNGATLGKKLLRLRIVSNKDNTKVSVINYIIRCILLYQPIAYLTKLITINFLSVNDFYNLNSIVYNIHSCLEFIILTFMMVRLDKRGLHDILANTKVISLDKEGNELL